VDAILNGPVAKMTPSQLRFLRYYELFLKDGVCVLVLDFIVFSFIRLD
jgi:hypothetical protein